MPQENPTPQAPEGASTESESWISPAPLWSCWTQANFQGPGALGMAAEQTDIPEINAAYRPFAVLYEGLKPLLGYQQSSTLEAVVNDLTTRLVEIGALAGFALARTWPTSPLEVNGWPARARAISGLREAGYED